MTLTLPSKRAARRRPALRPLSTPASVAFRLALPWLLGSLAMIMGAMITLVPAWTLLVFAACAVWRLLIEWRGGSLPSMPVRTLVFLPVAFLLIQKFHERPGSATAMLAFLIALVSLKILELRSPRDFTVVALLSYFMVLSAFFFDQSLALSLYLVLAVAVNIVALIRCHSGGRRAVWPALRLAGGLTAQTLPLVVLLFVVFPRVHGEFLRKFTGGAQGQTGMSDHLTPGSFSSLAQSNELAFRAEFAAGQTLTADKLYWRGLVLDLCEHPLSWRAESGEPAMRADKPTSGGIEQKITLIPQGERWLFALDRPTDVKNSSNIRAQVHESNVLRSQAPLFNTTVYTAYSDLTPVAAETLEPRERRRYTRLPADVSARALALAQSWKQQAHSDDEIVQAASRFFRTGGFTYTLTPGLLPPDDALDYFLFTSKQGFCEHYAAAFSTLMRAAGIPARVVVGYQGGEYNRWGVGHYTIRQSDSHAWSEVYIRGRGWQRQDPTALVAPERVSYGAESYTAFLGDGPLSDEMRLDRLNALNAPGSLHWLFHNGSQAWDAIDQQWNSLVLGYDQDTQLTVMEKLGVSSLSWLGGTALTLAVAFSLLGLGVLGMRALGGSRPPPVDPARRLYESFCARLARAVGVRRTVAEGPLDFSRRAVEAAPAHAREIERITQLYVASRYAVVGAPDQATADLRSAVQAFRPVKASA